MSSDKILPLLSQQAIQQWLFLLGCNPANPHRFGVLKVLKLARKVRFSLLLDEAPGRRWRQLALLKCLPLLSPCLHLFRRVGCFAGLEEGSTVRWWSKAVNFISLLFLAAFRTPASPWDTLSPLCVGCVLG